MPVNVVITTTKVKGESNTIHYMRKRAPKADPVSVRFDLDQLEAIDRIADEERLSKLDTIRRLIDEAVKARSSPRLEPYRAEPSADAPQEFHYTEMPVCGLAAAGVGRQPALVDLDETARVINPLARKAQKGGWKVIRVVGNSMETTYYHGDLVLMEPCPDLRRVKSRDIIYCLLNGEPQVKEYRETRGRVSLMPHNLEEHSPIPIMEDDALVLLGFMRDLVGREHANGKR